MGSHMRRSKRKKSTSDFYAANKIFFNGCISQACIDLQKKKRNMKALTSQQFPIKTYFKRTFERESTMIAFKEGKIEGCCCYHFSTAVGPWMREA